LFGGEDELVKMPVQVMEKFNDLSASKFMATVDEKGNPNVVPIVSIVAADAETLMFADIMMWKTKRNLLNNGKVACAVITKDNIAYQCKGKFQGFQKSGPLFDLIASVPLLKYNVYQVPRAVGTIKVEEVYSACPPLGGKRIA
jgi:predicted pyridoxine 5'-phosphate oxidase superfamily flavin-nucleotide-binding protein